ncbi:MAG: hypothetical protein M1834_003213 [Cirrosporium novae-zelandiae]|nr:MAG: hypothetical protein M1834_003213 [Cirrosporium novae-zelandiae]
MSHQIYDLLAAKGFVAPEIAFLLQATETLFFALKKPINLFENVGVDEIIKVAGAVLKGKEIWSDSTARIIVTAEVAADVEEVVKVDEVEDVEDVDNSEVVDDDEVVDVWVAVFETRHTLSSVTGRYEIAPGSPPLVSKATPEDLNRQLLWVTPVKYVTPPQTLAEPSLGALALAPSQTAMQSANFETLASLLDEELDDVRVLNELDVSVIELVVVLSKEVVLVDEVVILESDEVVLVVEGIVLESDDMTLVDEVIVFESNEAFESDEVAVFELDEVVLEMDEVIVLESDEAVFGSVRLELDELDVDVAKLLAELLTELEIIEELSVDADIEVVDEVIVELSDETEEMVEELEVLSLDVDVKLVLVVEVLVEDEITEETVGMLVMLKEVLPTEVELNIEDIVVEEDAITFEVDDWLANKIPVVDEIVTIKVEPVMDTELDTPILGDALVFDDAVVMVEADV